MTAFVPAYAQQPRPVIGFLNAGHPQALASFAAAFVGGLKETGYLDGQNVTVEYRWAQGMAGQLPQLAAELVGRRIDLLAAFGTPSARAAKNAVAGTPIPVVFANGSDPVADGLVTSMNRPDGNMTGVTSISASIVPKRLELLRAVAPKNTTIGVLINPSNRLSVTELDATRSAAERLGERIAVAHATNAAEAEAAFAKFASGNVGAAIITTDLFLFGHMPRLAALASQHRLPAIAPLKEFVSAGGLMCYGASISDAYRQAGVYAGRVLKGQSTTELPILQPTQFEFVINLRTAKAMNVEVPTHLLALTNEVIE